jgi:hypothetical protein
MHFIIVLHTIDKKGIIMQTVNHSLQNNDVVSSLPPVGEPTIRQTRIDVYDTCALVEYNDGSLTIAIFDGNHDAEVHLSPQEVQILRHFIEALDTITNNGYQQGREDARNEEFAKHPLEPNEKVELLKSLAQDYESSHDEEALVYSMNALAGHLTEAYRRPIPPTHTSTIAH